jgi:predicted dehydrogenase
VTQAIHLPTLARLPDLFEVARVFDVDPEVAQSVATRAGARSAGSLAELLDDPAVDVVAICSPHNFHAEQTIAACRAGKKAVLCEKPFATTVAEAIRIAEAAEQTSTPVVVGAMHRFDPGWLAASANWGELGETVHAIRSSIVLPPNPRMEDFATEVVNRPRSGPAAPMQLDAEIEAAIVRGGVLGLAIHNLPLVRMLLPTIADVQVLSARALLPWGYHIFFTAGGVRVELHAVVSATWRPQWVFEAYSQDRSLEMEFTPSYVHAGSAVAHLRSATSTETFGPYTHNGYEGEWRALAAVVHGTVPAPDVHGQVADLRLSVEVAEQSSELIRSTRPEGVLA